MKLNNTLKTISFAAVLMAGFSSCKKDKMPDITPGPIMTLGVYVLNEGAYSAATGNSNSSISYYDIASKSVEKDYFKKQNGIDLGVNANDLQQYGSKLYCVVTGSTPQAKDSYVEVMSVATGKSLKRISFSDDKVGFLPRYVMFYKDKAYVSSYDGKIAKVDTASLSIDSRIAVGGALEQMAIVNNKLYVTNSDHFMYATSNNASLSVVDLNTFTKLKEIPVAINPTKISASPSGDLFVVTRGVYMGASPTVTKVSSVTDIKISENDKISVEFLAINGNNAFVIGDYTDPFLNLFTLATGTVGTKFITDATDVKNPYGVTVNPLSKDVFVGDINSSSMFCFTADGKNKFSFTVGSFPKLAAFRYGF